MVTKTCHYCKEERDFTFGVHDKDVDVFYCYNCVEHCSICNNISPQDESFHCDYRDSGTTCNKPFHWGCGTENIDLGWLCNDHKNKAS